MNWFNSVFLSHSLSRLPCSFLTDFGTVKFKELIFLVMFHPIPANVGSSVFSMTWIQRYRMLAVFSVGPSEIQFGN